MRKPESKKLREKKNQMLQVLFIKMILKKADK